jgi:hypothetical protein
MMHTTLHKTNFTRFCWAFCMNKEGSKVLVSSKLENTLKFGVKSRPAFPLPQVGSAVMLVQMQHK